MNSRAAQVMVAAGLVGCGLSLVTGCTGGHSSPPTASPVASSVAATPSVTAPAASPTATTAPAGPAPPRINPLTGGKPVAGPVIAVKIDDTAPGRPQLNINEADIVYIEEVEGGLSRLLAIYDSNKPTVGYVRSVRPSDPELLRQYGKITLAASGGAKNPRSILAHSGLHSWLMDDGKAFYQRDTARASSYINVELNLAALSKQIKTPGARSIGFTWNASPAGLAQEPSGMTVSTKVGATPVRFDYDRKLERYVRVIGGVWQHEVGGALVDTPNVIVQNCSVTPHPADTDVNHNPSQFTHTVGHGRVTVLRNGRRITGTWSRASDTAGTILRDSAGRPITLAPGGAWIVLVRTATKVAVR